MPTYRLLLLMSGFTVAIIWGVLWIRTVGEMIIREDVFRHLGLTSEPHAGPGPSSAP